MRGQGILLAVLAALVTALGSASTAQAISISITSSANNTTSSTSGPGGDRAGAQGLTIGAASSTPDAVSASVSTGSRYVSNAAADRGIAISGGTARWTYNTDYTISFSVTPDSLLALYEVVIDTRILGELTLLDDVGATASTAKVSNVTGYLNAVVTTGLGISGIAQTFSVGTGLNDAQERNIAGSNSLNLGSFTGPQAFTLRFTFQTEASAP